MNLKLVSKDDAKHVACEKYHFGLCAMRGYRLCRMAECQKYVLLDEAGWQTWHNERLAKFRGRGIFQFLQL